MKALLRWCWTTLWLQRTTTRTLRLRAGAFSRAFKRLSGTPPSALRRAADFDGDARAFADCDDFMLGPSLLVANVIEPGQRERSVYLPRGVVGWCDFQSGDYHPADAEIVVDAPLDRIPLFAPAGALIPMTRGDGFRGLHDEPSRHACVFPAQGTSRATFAVYETTGSWRRPARRCLCEEYLSTRLVHYSDVLHKL